MEHIQPNDHGWRTLYCVFCGHMIKAVIDCGHRFCPVCSRRRARRIRNRLQFLLKSTKLLPRAGIKMLTLSKANCSELDVGIRDLVASFRRLRQRSLWKHYVLAGAFVIEVKGRPGNWHPHIHAIIHSYYIPWARLRAAWRQCSGGTAVWINAVSNERAMSYVTKYITKPDVPPFLLDVASAALRRFRLFTRFGDWHNVVLPKLIFDTPCPKCIRCDWIVDFEIDRRIKYPDSYPSPPPLAPPSARGGERPGETTVAPGQKPRLQSGRNEAPPRFL